MNKFNLKFSRVYSNSMFVKNLYSLPKFNYTSTANSGSAESINKNKSNEINVKSDEKNYHYPIRGFPKFENGLYTVFKYQPSERLPLIPYEIKECAMKGFLYTFFLTWGGRVAASTLAVSTSVGVFIPWFTAGIFAFQYGRAVNYMLNAITSIKLKENGTHVIFEFKNLRRPLEVEIWRIAKKKEIEVVIQESFAEPYLLPIEINYDDITGIQSLRSRKTFYIYGDSHSCIKDGELLRAIVNSQSIKLN